MPIVEQLIRTENHANAFHESTNMIAMQDRKDISVLLTDDLRHAVLGASEYCGDAADIITNLRSHLKRIIAVATSAADNAVYWENDGVPVVECGRHQFGALCNVVNMAEKYLNENGG